MSEASGYDPFPPSRSPAQEAAEAFRQHVRWDVKDIVIGIFAALVLLFVVQGIIVLPVLDAYGDDSPELYFASAIAGLVWNVAYVGAVIWRVRRSGGSLPDLGLRRGIYVPRDIYDRLRRRLHSMTMVWWPRLLLIIVSGYVAAYLSVLVYNLIVALTGLDFLEPDQQIPDDVFDHAAVVAATGIGVVLSAPIAEEILFRGFLFAGLRRYFSLWPAAFVSGFIFSLAHANLGLVIPFTLIGVVLAFTYERSGTLWGAIGVHFVFNAVSFLALVFVPDLRESGDSVGTIIAPWLAGG